MSRTNRRDKFERRLSNEGRKNENILIRLHEEAERAYALEEEYRHGIIPSDEAFLEEVHW